MGIAHFAKNAAIRIQGKAFVMRRMVEEGLWQIEEEQTGRIHEKSDSELRALYADKQLEFVKVDREARKADRNESGSYFRLTPPHLWDPAKVRRSYVLALKHVPMTKGRVEAAARKHWEKIRQPETCPHFVTLTRWKRGYIDAGNDVHGVVAQVHKQGNRKSRYDEPVLDIVKRSIDTVYLTQERKTEQDTLDHAISEIKRQNKLLPAASQMPEPTRRLVHRLITDIPAFDRCVARYGRITAVRRFRSVQGHRITDEPLERCEIDHTLLDIMVIDDDSGLPLGRPVLTACVDDNTRCVLGLSIGFVPPSFLAVARCLKDAFLPKTDLRKKYPDIENEWDAHGVMRELTVDQGIEFHSDSLEQACFSLGIEVHYAPRKTPWFKGKIERFLGTLNKSVAHGAPGTTFSNIFERGDYDPLKHAVVRYSTLKWVVRKWVADVYHQKPHRALQQPPAALWKSSIRPADVPVPADPAALDAILGRRVGRTLTHKGIEFEGLFYNSPELADLRRRRGDKLDVQICVDDGDIGSLIVLYEDDSRMFVVPALRADYAKGLTLWQHKVCKRFADSELSKFDASGWLEAKRQIADRIRDEFALAKGKQRTRAARYVHGGDSDDAGGVAQGATQPAAGETVAVTPPAPAATQPPPPPAPVAANPPAPLPPVAVSVSFAPQRRVRRSEQPVSEGA